MFLMSGNLKSTHRLQPLNGEFWVNADGFLINLRRVSLFCGGYGSGKSEVAVNFAVSLAEMGKQVVIADLDIVNPYFRSREARAVLASYGVRVLAPDSTVMESDLPIISPEIKGAIVAGVEFVVLDLGGDPVGARVLSSIEEIKDQADFNSFFVLNSRRPFTRTVEQVWRLMLGIEESAGVPVTHIVVNSHLIEETDESVVREGIELAEAVSRLSGKPIGFVVVERKLFNHFTSDVGPYPVLVIDRMLLKPWEKPEKLGPAKFRI